LYTYSKKSQINNEFELSYLLFDLKKKKTSQTI